MNGVEVERPLHVMEAGFVPEHTIGNVAEQEITPEFVTVRLEPTTAPVPEIEMPVPPETEDVETFETPFELFDHSRIFPATAALVVAGPK